MLSMPHQIHISIRPLIHGLLCLTLIHGLLCLYLCIQLRLGLGLRLIGMRSLLAPWNLAMA